MATVPVPRNEDRLRKAEETLILLIRTYLQRVSSKLSATEFVELAKAAVALLDKEQLSLSLPERKRLLYRALQTFDTQLSQPIPALGEQIPKHIATPLARLVRYQKIMRTEGLEATLITLTTQILENMAQRLSSDTLRPAILQPMILRAALENSTVTIAPELTTEDGLDDLAKALFFKIQLQTPSPRATKSEQEIAAQLDQAIAEFKAKYQPLPNIAQPRWDNDLSVSSALFTSQNFASASYDATWLPETTPDKNSKDATNT